MATQVWNQANFQAQFPEFTNTAGASLLNFWTMATQYIAPTDGAMLQGAALLLALNLLTAHFARLYGTIGAGAGNNSPSLTTAASQGSVSVSFAPPPYKDGWQYWLGQTPYGQQLWALLQAQTVGGIYASQNYPSGYAERSAYRKAGGVF